MPTSATCNQSLHHCYMFMQNKRLILVITMTDIYQEPYIDVTPNCKHCKCLKPAIITYATFIKLLTSLLLSVTKRRIHIHVIATPSYLFIKILTSQLHVTTMNINVSCQRELLSRYLSKNINRSWV